ncbi:MAG: sensor histidine kinase [Acidimicrobiales bacterium]
MKPVIAEVVDTGAPTVVSPSLESERSLVAARSRRRFRWSGTAARLAAFHALLIAVVLGVILVQFTLAFGARYRSSVVKDLNETAISFELAAIHRPASESLARFVPSYLANRNGFTGDPLVIALPTSGVTIETPHVTFLAHNPQIREFLRIPPRHSVLVSLTIDRTPYLVLAVPIRQGSTLVGTLVTAGSLSAYRQSRDHFLRLVIGEGLIILVVAVLSVYIILRRLLGSVHRLTRAAAEIGLRGELDIRLDEAQHGDEVGEMAATFDSMVDRIDKAMSAQRQLLADVSHQLRTPLTVVRGHLELLDRRELERSPEIRETVQSVLEELESMNRLIGRLTLLGRSLEADFLEVGAIDLRSLMADLYEAVGVIAPRRWIVPATPDIIFNGDLEKIRGAVLNLVDNAIRETGENDTLMLAATVTSQGGVTYLEFSVDDSGPGIAPEDREIVLRRFGRSQSVQREGTGLGLAIVSAVAQSHGGSLRLEDSSLGGCRAVMSITYNAIYANWDE